MAKVLLIEDDTNLREIFAMRLQAEGYETLSAGDGEEGLVVAMKQKPNLIIADVMMPKLSGFEMLETLRATPEMRDIRVIMMTALGQAEDRTRGEKLGVVKYLVKSQVTLEDFVRVVRDVLKPGNQAEGTKAVADDEQAKTINNNEGSEKPMQNDQNPASNPGMPGGDSQPAANPMGDGSAAPAGNQMSTADEQAAVQSQVDNFAATPPVEPAADSSAPVDGSTMPAADPAASAPADPAASTPPADTPPAAPAV